MTPEELMRPRFKVIAPYPGSNTYFEVGEIFEWSEGHDQYVIFRGPENSTGFEKYTVEKYPHLFRKLKWWEERKVEDMPEYVKNKFGRVYKINEVSESGNRFKYVGGDQTHFSLHFDGTTPSTESEYLAQEEKK